MIWLCSFFVPFFFPGSWRGGCFCVTEDLVPLVPPLVSLLPYSQYRGLLLAIHLSSVFRENVLHQASTWKTSNFVSIAPSFQGQPTQSHRYTNAQIHRFDKVARISNNKNDALSLLNLLYISTHPPQYTHIHTQSQLQDPGQVT